MPKTKKPKQVDSLTGEQYWKWMSHIERMNVAKKNVELAEAIVNSARKDLQLAQHAVRNSNRLVVDKKEEAEQAKSNYHSIKEDIEKAIGRSLNGVAIDEYTLAISNLSEEETS